MGARETRSPPTPGSGRHFLSPRRAAEFVRALDLDPDEIVVEIGAGTGRLTQELCARARLVLAVELDPRLARRLLSSECDNLLVHRGDAITVVTPDVDYRVVGNAPFGIGTALLRRFLDDPRVARLDLILQREVARKRAAGRGNVLAVVWAATWHLRVAQEFPRATFHPAPGVDAAWLSARRRAVPLVPRHRLPEFERFIRRSFTASARSLKATGVRAEDLASSRIGRRGRPIDLDVDAWIRLFETVSARRAARGRRA